MTSGEAFEDIYYTSRDGLRLHARRYAASGGSGRHARPVTLPTRSHAQWPRLPRSRRCPQQALAHAADHLHPRLSRSRALRLRSRLAQLRAAHRDAGRHRLHHLERPAGRRTDRHLARRPNQHAAGGGPADRGGRRRAERYRSGDRARGNGSDQRLRRPRTPADLLAGRRTHDARTQPPPLSRDIGGGLGGRGAPVVQREERQASARLRFQSRQRPFGTGRPDADAVAAVRSVEACAADGGAGRELRHPHGRRQSTRCVGGTPPWRPSAWPTKAMRRC